jgi:serine/threonine protein kinase
MYCRPPKEDPLFGARGLNEVDSEYLASVAPWVVSKDNEDKPQSTGYLAEPPRLRRKGPVPRKPLPIGFMVDVLRQVCEAVAFMHEKAGMVHGDINPDNIIMVQCHDESSLKNNWGKEETTPYVPSSSQIKLVDLNASCFIPVGIVERRPGAEDYDDLSQADPSTISPLTSSSNWMKKSANNKDVRKNMFIYVCVRT